MNGGALPIASIKEVWGDGFLTDYNRSHQPGKQIVKSAGNPRAQSSQPQREVNYFPHRNLDQCSLICDHLDNCHMCRNYVLGKYGPVHPATAGPASKEAFRGGFGAGFAPVQQTNFDMFTLILFGLLIIFMIDGLTKGR